MAWGFFSQHISLLRFILTILSVFSIHSSFTISLLCDLTRLTPVFRHRLYRTVTHSKQQPTRCISMHRSVCRPERDITKSNIMLSLIMNSCLAENVILTLAYCDASSFCYFANKFIKITRQRHRWTAIQPYGKTIHMGCTNICIYSLFISGF